jgi:tRNA 5-methylaminomethyl-2-thiouridine biosynthesis bifunctional protein
VVLTTGFGQGQLFLATWDTWRRDPQRSERLCFIAIEAAASTTVELTRAHANTPLVHLAQTLLAAWPPLTPDLHSLAFEAGRVQLMLAVGEAHHWLPELVASVDAFFVDLAGTPAGGRDARDAQFCKALGRLAAPEATLEAGLASPAFSAGLTTAGFHAHGGPGITQAHYAPRFEPRRPIGRRVAAATTERRALIIGAGLAGCAAACALAEQGWHSTLLERHADIAAEGSGNPAGLFHGIVNGQDGLHARFNRAAALSTTVAVQTAITEHRAQGSTAGLLRLETQSSHEQMQQVLHALALPASYVRAVTAAQASALGGLPLAWPAWFYLGGGWVQPAALARSYIERTAGQASVRSGVHVQALRFAGGEWQALDANGHVIDAAPVLLLANAGDALRLLGAPGWPIDQVRGQISSAAVSAFGPEGLPGRARLPVAGAGYLLPTLDGRVMFGATAQRGDDDPSVRHADHIANLAQLARLTDQPLALDPSLLDGRTAWRWSSHDRLPVIGAVPAMPCIDLGQPAPPATHRRADQARFVARVPGLFVFTALGSRGITWSTLGGRVVAAAISGAPAPLASNLLDAIDPARFIARELRRSRAA